MLKQQCAIYARYSSHAQREVSIDQQIKEIKKFTEREGLEVVEIYIDRAMSGTNDRRPEFQRMIREAELGRFQYIVVYTLDRFARDRYDSAVYKRQLKNCGVKVLSAMENIGDDPTGVLMESMLEGLAEYYSKELSRKINRGLDDNAEKCLVCGSLPYGYMRGEDGKFAIREDQAAIIREIFSRVADGEAFVSLINDLNRRGLRTKSGKPWGKSSFNKMLSNERYTGVYIYRDKRVEGGVPAIVDKELFDRVQIRMQTKSNPRNAPNKRRRENSTYLLTGKLFCGKCKSPMVGISGKSSSPEPYYYYTCKRRRNHTCDKEMVRREWAEETIAKAIQDYILNDDVIEWLADKTVEHLKEQSKGTPETMAMAERLKEVIAAKNNIIKAIEQGVFTATVKERLLALEDEEKTLSIRLSLEKSKLTTTIEREHILGWLISLRNGDVKDKGYQEMLIDAFLVAAYLYDDHWKIVVKGNSNERNIDINLNIDNIVEDSEVEAKICIEFPQLHH